MPFPNIATLLLTISLAFGPTLQAQELSWPRDLDLESGVLTMYQPQVDSLDGNVLSFRAAVAFKDADGSEPVFGASWYESRVEVDRETRMVHMADLSVTGMRFPEGSEHVHGELESYIRASLPNWNVDLSLDALLTSLEAAEEEILAAANLKMDPPVIIYRDRPALLVYIDGEPVWRDIENSEFRAVINTPYPLIHDGGRYYYLNAARDVWYRADEVTGPWALDRSPPKEISALVDQDEAGEASDEKITEQNAPEIVVSMEPAELIVTDGAPDFEPLVDDLLVLKNSQSDIFMHVSAQDYYIVLAGRWYRAKSLQGPWSFNSSDQLPTAFNNIPVDSRQADARVFVAGTDEAREAVMDAQIPQTAVVHKGEVDIEVSYDGDPRFDTIESTNLSYAVNTASTVLKSGDKYYLVEDAVWYLSAAPTGPWRVAESRPEGVESIPPESPVYNVKYVYIYDSSPEVVYVGYTPGYTGSYVYHTTIVYGTGWYYRPWISPYYYYPRYGTWGFHITYNPWTGWGFGISWGWGPFRVGFHTGGYWHRHHHWHHRHYGRWGPAGYRPRPVHYGDTNINNINVNRGSIGSGNIATRDNNLYRDKAQKAQVAKTRDFRPGTQEVRERAAMSDRATSRDRVGAASQAAVPDRGSAARPSQVQNNVFTDRNGNVYRQTDGGWQKNDGKGWASVPSTGSRDAARPSTGAATSTTRPSPGASTSGLQGSASGHPSSYSTRQSSAYQRPNSGYNSHSSLDRQSYSRQRSTTRSHQFNAQRSRGGRRR